MKIIESYKITGMGISVKRRETEKGAMALADKLRSKGKHGTVEAVWYDNNKEDAQIEFEVIRTF